MVTFMKHVFAAWNYHETNLEYTYKTKRISLHIYIYINMSLDFVSTYVLDCFRTNTNGYSLGFPPLRQPPGVQRLTFAEFARHPVGT